MWLKYDSDVISGPFSYREQQKEPPVYKPVGFWVTDDTEDNWPAWCRSADCMHDRVKVEHEVTLDESGILFLRSVGDMHEFMKMYGRQREFGFGAYTEGTIDWWAVAQKHTGIIITPYQWSLRMEAKYFWYYGWDCASGCIWDPAAILDVKVTNANYVLGEREEAD